MQCYFRNFNSSMKIQLLSIDVLITWSSIAYDLCLISFVHFSRGCTLACIQLWCPNSKEKMGCYGELYQNPGLPFSGIFQIDSVQICLVHDWRTDLQEWRLENANHQKNHRMLINVFLYIAGSHRRQHRFTHICSYIGLGRYIRIYSKIDIGIMHDDVSLDLTNNVTCPGLEF